MTAPWFPGTSLEACAQAAADDLAALAEADVDVVEGIRVEDMPGLDAEVPCESLCGCSNAAAWLLLNPCGCRPSLCDGCKRLDEPLLEAWTAQGSRMRCQRCGTRRLDPAAVRWVRL